MPSCSTSDCSFAAPVLQAIVLQAVLQGRCRYDPFTGDMHCNLLGMCSRMWHCQMQQHALQHAVVPVIHC